MLKNVKAYILAGRLAMGTTIYDVARLSGVSTATVSRAFFSPDQVRAATLSKVYEAAEELHYHPNAIARAMARQRTDKIAYLICKKGATILDEFYAGICDGIMCTANRSDYQLLVSTEEDWQSVNASMTKQIEGVVLGGNAQRKMISDFQEQNIEVVLVNNRIDGLSCVVADEAGGVRQVVDHLADRGHRHIAMLVGRFSPYIIRERYQAFLRAMEERGLPVASADIRFCDPDVNSATREALELLQGGDRPTAVFALNDVIAAGIIKAARRLGMRLPEDLAVAGYDDSSICPMLEPELTSVHVDCRQMGELAVSHLMAQLNGEENLPPLTVVPARLQVRAST